MLMNINHSHRYYHHQLYILVDKYIFLILAYLVLEHYHHQLYILPIVIFIYYDKFGGKLNLKLGPNQQLDNIAYKNIFIYILI